MAVNPGNMMAYNILSPNNVIRAIILHLKHFTNLFLLAKLVLGWDLEKGT